MGFGSSQQQDMLRDEWRGFLAQVVPLVRVRVREMGEAGGSCQPALLLSTSGVAMVLVEQGSEAQRTEWCP